MLVSLEDFRRQLRCGDLTDTDLGYLALDHAGLLYRRSAAASADGFANETGRVFTREDGTALRDGWVSTRFAALGKAAGLPPVRFHDLRHGGCRWRRPQVWT